MVIFVFSSLSADSRVKDIATVEGVRDNPLVGYGMVVGLKGTGDSQQTAFSMQTLANILRRMGLQVPSTIQANNVAAVFVTAALPPFAHPGTHIDVTVSSTGDAKSLGGGLLLLTSLSGGDGQVYAVAQGALTLGGYSASSGPGNSVAVNHPTVGRVPSGAIVERETSVDLNQMKRLALELRDPDFTTARDMAAAINREFGREIARAIDSREVEIERPALGQSVPLLLARIENVTLPVQARAKVVINERTGTVVMGKDVRISGISILHGALSIGVSTEYQVSQPLPNSKGETTVVPQTTLKAEDKAAKHIDLASGATVEDFVRGLQRIGATPRDIVAILQAIKEAGALQAELEVL